jgi:predicted TIM-barrel fold metal-dependent hydrolase
MSDAPFCPAPDAHPHAPHFAVPPGATDCHAHVFEAARYGYQAERSYTPPDSTIGQLRAMHKALGIQRLVVVAASVHGTNNAPVLDAIATDPKNLRGIATVGADISDKELTRLKDGGIRGIRVNLVDKGGNPFGSLDGLSGIAERIRDLGFHIELLVHVESFSDLRGLAKKICVPLSVGHIGYTKVASGGLNHPGYQEFLALLRDGYFWVKLTGPSRLSAHESFPYPDVTAMAKAAIAAAPDRVVWGSDWPHVMQYKPMPNDGDLLDALAEWAPDAAQRQRILVDNPARLYGFA